MDQGTVSILIEKLNAAKKIINTAAPNNSNFSTAIQNITKIEEMLRQSGLIQIGEEWVYPATGWISSNTIDLRNVGIKVLSRDFTARTIDGRIIDTFSHLEIDTLSHDMLANNLALPSSGNASLMSRFSFHYKLKENQVYMTQGDGWINRMRVIDTPGGLGFRYYAEDISMDYSKDRCRVRFRTIE